MTRRRERQKAAFRSGQRTGYANSADLLRAEAVVFSEDAGDDSFAKTVIEFAARVARRLDIMATSEGAQHYAVRDEAIGDVITWQCHGCGKIYNDLRYWQAYQRGTAASLLCEACQEKHKTRPSQSTFTCFDCCEVFEMPEAGMVWRNSACGPACRDCFEKRMRPFRDTRGKNCVKCDKPPEDEIGVTWCFHDKASGEWFKPLCKPCYETMEADAEKQRQTGED